MATKTRSRKSATRKNTAADEARKARRAQITEDLKAAEEAFEYDEDDARQVRAFESLTSHYSEGNALLILAQAAQQGRRVRGLQDVGGFGAWGDRGRSVKKGEHQSIFIWAKAGTSTDETVPAPDATGPASTDEKVRTYYRPVGLFHISQTEDKAVAQARREAEQAV